ncbi:hypothetical protein KVR01_012620 [Diaporthe batatas]|uniref:uncharacterized protein n=1 Tax=Diaporthe batatas TaxID=748121 RepID=UPI001D04F968|nr:uncharacterized protein KVR01_012620 [Diaporthe batatas]KAG8157578.1 hypothetical protein KVR01_012620 [Diaporthe batatas]
MTSIETPKDFSGLKGKTVLLTGCASGIGRAVAQVAYANGANLALADWNEDMSRDLIAELGGSQCESRVLYHKVDVSNWDAVNDFFTAAVEKFGVIHAVLSNAGMVAHENLFEDNIDPATGKLMAPNLKNLEVNLIAHLYMVKCAVHHFAKRPDVRNQIVITGSVASFIDTPPLYFYETSKSGLLGLMRCLRTQLASIKTTVNLVAPWLTATGIPPPHIVEAWGNDLATNTPEGVAKALLLPVVEESLNGKTLWVAGNDIVEVEDKLHETQPLWLGEELSKNVDEGQRRLISKRGLFPDLA